MSRSLPPQFNVNRPFLFFVWDSELEIILFQAKLSSPTFT